MPAPRTLLLAPLVALCLASSPTGCARAHTDIGSSAAPVTPAGITTLALDLGNGQFLYAVVDGTNAQTAAILAQMTQAAQTAANQAAAAGASIAAQQSAAAGAAMNTARSFATVTDNAIRVASLVTDGAGNTATNAGVMAANGMGYCVESSALTLSSLGQVTLSDGSKASAGFVMAGFQATAADGSVISHVVLGNLSADIIVDVLVPGTGTAGVYSFALADTLYTGIKFGGVFQPATLPASLQSVLLAAGLPAETPVQIIAQGSASDLVPVSSAAAEFLANPAVQVGLKALGFVGDVAYVYQGYQFSEHLYAQTTANVAAVLGPFWNAKFPSESQAKPPQSVPYYPGLTGYLMSNGIDPSTIVSDPGGAMWFSDGHGRIISVVIQNDGTYRVSEPNGVVADVDQSGKVVYDLGVTFSVTGYDCNDPDSVMDSDGNCVPNPHRCDPLASETTCSIGAGSAAENGGYCDDATDPLCLGGSGAVFGTQEGASNVGCDPNSDPTCPPGGDFCDPSTDPGCSDLQGQSGGGSVPPSAAAPTSPLMHQPWADMRYTDVGIPPPSSPAWPTSDFATYRGGNDPHYYPLPFDWDYEGESNGKRYFALYPRSIDVTPLTAFATNESVGTVHGDGTFQSGYAACSYAGVSLDGTYYQVPLTVESFDPNELVVSMPSSAPPTCDVIVSQHHDNFDYQLTWGWTDNILSGPALATTLAGTDATIPLSWKSRGAKQTQVHMGSPGGPVVASGGTSGSATVGGVTDGTVFYLVDATTGAMLVSYTAAVLQLLPPATPAPKCTEQVCGGACAAGTGNVAGSGSGCTLKGVSPPVSDLGDLVQAAVDDVKAVLEKGWMTPCTGDGSGATFCPHETVTRGEAATILVRGLYGDAFTLSGTPWMPGDVDASDWRLPYIQKAYEVGITHGTSATTFSPDQPMTRDQMAALIVRTWSIASGFGPEGFPAATCAHPLFGDVPRSDVFFPYVQKLRELGITSGTGSDPLTYGPEGSSERWQVAVFVMRALGGAAPAPAPCCPNTECTKMTCGEVIPVSCTNIGGSSHLACGGC